MIVMRPSVVEKKPSMGRSLDRRYPLLGASGRHYFGVECLQPPRERRRDGVNRISDPNATLFLHICADMSRKAEATDKCILRGRAAGISLQIVAGGTARHLNPEIHKIIVKQTCGHALVNGRRRNGWCHVRCALAGGQHHGRRTKAGKGPNATPCPPQTAYSAAILVSLRAFALADNSAIRPDARVIAFVR